ncbi:MAG TPA: hypothetical protein ENN08_06665 [Bacteroidales bacterium]|nr:hypothetical protein [Bacteroidales bacterium]
MPPFKTRLFTGLLMLGLFCIPEATAKNPVMSDELPAGERMVFFKTDQGFTLNRLLDQKMSDLLYTGLGFALNFGLRAQGQSYISEWNFVSAEFRLLSPAHKSTEVQQPGIGFSYKYLRQLSPVGIFDIWAGAQARVFTSIRLAPRLGNLSMYADIIAALRPQAALSTSFNLFRTWQMDADFSATILGYGLRFPEYGTIYRIGGDGGISQQEHESQMLHPMNFGHFTAGIFFGETFGGENNPNWFRIGYIWDFYSMSGKHQLNVHKASRQLLPELYFRIG